MGRKKREDMCDVACSISLFLCLSVCLSVCLSDLFTYLMRVRPLNIAPPTLVARYGACIIPVRAVRYERRESSKSRESFE